MKVTKQLGHQGDTQWFAIDTIPANAKKVEKQFIAASERSGSFHALFGNYDMYAVDEADPTQGFIIDAKEECILNHSLEKELRGTGVSLENASVLPKKDHRHSVIPAGKYVVGIQNRFDPLENLKKRVID